MESQKFLATKQLCATKMKKMDIHTFSGLIAMSKSGMANLRAS
jgi:hypothetical protein